MSSPVSTLIILVVLVVLFLPLVLGKLNNPMVDEEENDGLDKDPEGTEVEVPEIE